MPTFQDWASKEWGTGFAQASGQNRNYEATEAVILSLGEPLREN